MFLTSKIVPQTQKCSHQFLKMIVTLGYKDL